MPVKEKVRDRQREGERKMENEERGCDLGVVV